MLESIVSNAIGGVIATLVAAYLLYLIGRRNTSPPAQPADRSSPGDDGSSENGYRNPVPLRAISSSPVVWAALVGTALQIGFTFANTMNIGGAADLIMRYGLDGQLASGGLIAALTGAYYSLTQRRTAHATATGAGAVAGGISGTLGAAITQALGWTVVPYGTTPLLNFSAILHLLFGVFGPADAGQAADPMFDPATLTQVFGATAAGGGLGSLLGRFAFGHEKHA